MEQSDLKANPVLFRRRMLGQQARIGDVVFTIRPITRRDALYIRTAATTETGEDDPDAYTNLMICCGLTNVTGLTDEDGAPVEVERDEVEFMGVKLTPVKRAWVECLDTAIVNQLKDAIGKLSGFGDEDRLRLDFTSPS